VKFTLVFDEDVDGPELLKLRGGSGVAKLDEIESDNENEQEGELIKVEIQAKPNDEGKASS
jgi:hypothetical protein